MNVLLIDANAISRKEFRALVEDAFDGIEITERAQVDLETRTLAETVGLVVINYAALPRNPVRETFGSTRVMVLGGVSSPEATIEILRLGVAGYVLAETEPVLILDVLVRLLEPPTASEKAAGRRSPLSFQEREVLRLILAGMSNRRIADELNLSPEMIKVRITTLMWRMNVRNRKQLVLAATSHCGN